MATAGGAIVVPLTEIVTGAPPSDAAMFDVETRTASAMAPRSWFTLLAKSAASWPDFVLKSTAFGPK